MEKRISFPANGLINLQQHISKELKKEQELNLKQFYLEQNRLIVVLTDETPKEAFRYVVVQAKKEKFSNKEEFSSKTLEELKNALAQKTNTTYEIINEAIELDSTFIAMFAKKKES